MMYIGNLYAGPTKIDNIVKINEISGYILKTFFYRVTTHTCIHLRILDDSNLLI